MTNHRVVFAQEAGSEGLCDRLLLQEAERTEASVGKECLIGHPELKPQRREQSILTCGRQRIAQPLPRIAILDGRLQYP